MFLLNLTLGLLLQLSLRAPATGIPPDSARLHATPALPDTARLRLLARLSSAYGPSSPSRCIHYAQQALPLARRLHAGETELGMLDNLAVSYGRLGNLPVALRHCMAELQRARELRNTRYEIDALLGVASLQTSEANQAEAGNTLRQALTLARRQGQPLALARVRSQLGSFYLERGQYDSCILVTRQALPIFEQLGRLYEQGYCLTSLAEAACGQKQFAAALRYGQTAARVIAQKGDVYGQSWVAGVLCRAALGSGQPALARQYGQQAVAFARRAGTTDAEEEILKHLIETYVQQRAWEEAFQWEHRRRRLGDSLYTQTRATEMARLQTQYETEAKRQEIRVLRHRARIQALERDRDQTRLVLVEFGAAALLLTLLLFAVLLRRLQRSRAALHQANRTKGQLLSIVGHDLRGPVAAFQQVGSMLRYYAASPDPAELTELADELEMGATQLAGLLDNLLHWARGQMGQVVNRPAVVSPAVAISTVLNLYRPAALAKHLTMVARLPPAPPAWVDAGLLDTILRNLVSNAIKFTPTGGTVEVSGQPTPTGDGIEFSVRDTGVGLTPEAAQALFEPAVSPTRGTAGEVGTGLGVAVCRQFVALLGGELRVTSTPGRGTRFWFVVPTAPAVALA